MGVWIGGAGRVDGRRLRENLVRAARGRGVALVVGRARLACKAARVVGVEIDGQLTEADAVIAAAGAWTTSFLDPAGVVVRVTPERGQIVHLRLGSADTSRWPVILPRGSGHYLLAFTGSRVVAGATREPGSGFDARVTAGGLNEVLTQALAVAPGLASATHLENRVGLRPAGPDIRPLLGPVQGVAGLVVATGLGASGLTLGPLAGAVAARTPSESASRSISRRSTRSGVARPAPRTRLSYAWWRYGRYDLRAFGQSVGYPEGSRPLVASFLPYPAGTPRA